MKILVYGAGVLGCNLARNLLRAGKDVTLLARGSWAAEIRQNGLFAFALSAGHREIDRVVSIDLKKLRGNTAYLNRVLDANIEGYRAIRDAGHTILPKEDADFEGEKYRKTCLRFFKLMCATSLGKLCASDHAMNAIDEMSALNRDLKNFFDENGAAYPVWQALEAEAGRYLQ